ncbi:hypothetical protein CSKR_112829 [Clonorchis sinensis]|uniref:Uncharacterized protein n=1 Tax=Clonorchis sinensis TaxID=79923 RepID=A0A3R7CDE2_CLOSI|nr:hypothetical protein CSKR_112829 [Clonorchis sinensis]
MRRVIVGLNRLSEQQTEIPHKILRRDGSEREFTDRKVRVSNPTSDSRLPLSRFRQPGSILAFVLPWSGMAARPRKDVTAERFFILVLCITE